MIKEYDEIMWNAIEDTLEEMYQNAYPPISWKQRLQEAKDGKDVDKDLISHHYLPKQLYEDIMAIAERNYSYEKFFKEYTDHFADFLINGGHARDIVKGGKDNYKNYKAIKDEIGDKAFAILEERIKAYQQTYRFDNKRWSFNFSVMNMSPCCCKERVIEYWKSKGVDLQIPTDKQIIDLYYDDEYEDEDGNIIRRDKGNY